MRPSPGAEPSSARGGTIPFATRSVADDAVDGDDRGPRSFVRRRRHWRSCCLALLGLLAPLPSSVCRAEHPPWAAWRFAPDALEETDIASDTAWTLRVDDGPPRPIRVPGGGWNSDRQDPPIGSAAARDHVVYERQIVIPEQARDRVVQVLFGGCNYGAEVWVDDRKVTEHHAPMAPFAADLTGAVRPGETHTLRVKAYTRAHYGNPPNVPVGFDFNKDVPGVRAEFNGASRFAYGITGHVRLAVYPPVRISDVFLRPSVSRKRLACDVWITNATRQPRTVHLEGRLVSGDSTPWPYPALPGTTSRVEAGATRRITLAEAPWTLGRESYWWPNIPFRDDYSPVFHWLELSLEEGGKSLHRRRQRFGFVEYAEGPYYYTVNGVRFCSIGDSLSYGQAGEFDTWTETPCFQPPHDHVRGCPEVWRRYQKIGFNTLRLSTSVPTPTMLDTADEAGFMILPEGASWGNGTSRFDPGNTARQLQELIRAVRNHPCVARYSLANESLPADTGDAGAGAGAGATAEERQLIDAALEVDPTRPLVFEVNKGQGSGAVAGTGRGHAWRMQHYDPVTPGGDHIRGLGEMSWVTDGLPEFAMEAVALRMNDYAHFAPWSWLNYWPNFLEGMSGARHPWTPNNYGDRQDGTDGWGSPIVETVRRSLHPYLVVDTDLLELNPSLKETSKDGRVDWPYRVPVLPPGEVIERRLEVFNGGLAGTSFSLRWSGRWDDPAGPVAIPPQISGPFTIRPGFHAPRVIRFRSPEPGRESRPLHLVVESIHDQAVVYAEARIRLVISRARETASAAWLGNDDRTRGDWPDKYGSTGFDLAGDQAHLPGDISLTWLQGREWTWRDATQDARALSNPPGRPSTAGGRTAACRTGDTVSFALDLGPAPRRLALYFVDWFDAGWKLTVRLTGADSGRELDRRTVASFQGGRWLLWKARGRIHVEITPASGRTAALSGVFLDPVR